MQTTSQLYKDILANPAHQKEWKAVIYDGETGTEYGQNNIVSIRLNSQLYGDALIGNACSGSIDLVLKKSENFPIIPKMAKMELYVRLVSSLYQWEKRSVITTYFWNKYTVGHRYYWNRYANIVMHHWKKYSVDVNHTDTNLGTTGTKNYSHVNTPETLVINSVPQIVVINGEPKYDFSGGRQTVVQTDYTPVGSFCAANSDSIKTAAGGVGNYQTYYAKVLSIKDNDLFGWIASSDANAEIHGIQTTRSRGTYIEDVNSANQGSYPQDGEQDGFWYVYDGYTQERGTFIDSVNSNNQSAYPQDGAQGDYWYVYDKSEDYRGDLIGEVSGLSSDEYPQDGIQNGYWYAIDRSEQQKGERIDTVTSENANAYPQDGAQGDYWYVYEGKPVSEWLPKGTYWVNQREEDIVSDTVTLHCVDGMMFGERDFFLPDDPIPPWENETMRTVAEMCAEKTGLTLENPNQFQNTQPYQLTAPPEGYTVRQVLSGIAAAHGGNVVVTPNNKIRLVPFIPTNTHVNIGTNIADFTLAKQYELFGQVIFNFEGIDGDTLTVLYPDVDEPEGPIIETKMLAVTDSEDAEDMVQAVYQSLGSYLYTPYTATDAILDPAMELGDGLTINGTYGVLAFLDETCDALYSATIGAPSFDETENEFVYQPKVEKNLQRQIAKSKASFKIGIDSIAQTVSGLAPKWESGKKYTVGEIVEYRNKFYRCIVANDDDEFDPDKWTEIDSGVVESILQLAIGKMTLAVNSLTSGSSIELTSGDITIASQRVYFQTDNLHISGKLAASQIETSQLVVGDNIQMGANATISWSKVTNHPTILDTDDVDGQIATYIDGHSIQASTLKGQYVYIYGSNGRTQYGTIYAGTNSVGTTALELYGSNGLRLTSGGNTYLTGNNGGSILIGYDTSGAGTAALSGVHINGLFCGSWLCMGSGYYGTGEPGSVVSSPKEGMLYFKITS